MVKIGDNVVVVSCPEWENCSAGDVFEVFDVPNRLGLWERSINGERHYVRMDGVEEGCAIVIVRPYTESEAEKRGAKFGVMGVVKDTGDRCVFLDESLILPGHWEIAVKGKAAHWHRKPSEIRLDHEPEFVAWEDAPEELKYDASRVYYDGKPVKWVAKPGGILTADVTYITRSGIIRCSAEALTVKL